MTQHYRKPITADPKHGYIGELPRSDKIGYRLVREVQYLLNWLQHGQIYTYSGPGFTDGDPSTELPNPHHTYTGDVDYYPIIYSPQKTDQDTGKTDRQLGGALLPWSYNGDNTNPVKILWTPPGGSEVTLYEMQGEYPLTDGNNRRYVYDVISHDEIIEIWNKEDDKFQYTPHAVNPWQMGKLSTEFIRTAALGIWTMPDVTLTEDQEQVGLGHVSPEKIIRALDAGGVASIGDLVQLLGDGTLDHDAVENMTMRCLLQSGHPRGIQCNQSSSYRNLRTESASVHSFFRVQSRNLLGSSSGTSACYPAVVLQTSGASGGNPGCVKYTSTTGSDTWTLEVTSDDASPTLYTYDQASGGSDTLDIDSDAADTVKIELKAPSSGTIDLFTYSLWEPLYFA